MTAGDYRLPMKALFITFEGVEGSGKSSQIANVAEYFTQKKYNVLRTREPGGTEIAEKIRSLLIHQQEEKLSPRAELLLMLASRAQHVDELIEKNMSKTDLILCDRFTDSTLAYQGAGRKMDMAWLKEMNRFATNMLQPDITFLMDLKVEDSQARIQHRKKRNEKNNLVDRFESENTSFHQRIRDCYLEIAKSEPDRFVILDATEKPKILLNKMAEAIENKLSMK